MKYFSLDWWINKCSRGEIERYQAYIGGIRRHLPPEILPVLDGEVSLHDARLRKLDLQVGEKELIIDLQGFKYTQRETEECRLSITLSYGSVRRVHSTANPSVGLRGPFGYGDLGYDEVELLEDGCIEHRLLFSSGIELAVRFQQFRLTYEDLPNAE